MNMAEARKKIREAKTLEEKQQALEELKEKRDADATGTVSGHGA